MTEIQSLEARIAAHEENAKALRDELMQRKQHAKAGVIEKIKATISEYDISQADLFGEKPAKSSKRTRVAGTRAVYHDINTHQIYRGGKFPAWLSERLAQTGMAYHAYRDSHMQRAN